MTNEEIYERFEATRDENLIALLFERNKGLIGRVLKKNGFVVDTEDVLQEGYIKVHAGLSEGKYSLQNNTKITAWMIRVVVNNAISTYRIQKYCLCKLLSW